MAAVPLTVSLVAVIVADPAANAVTKPPLVTLTLPTLELVQATIRPVRRLPLASFSVALSWSVWPTTRLPAAGVTDTVETATGGGGVVDPPTVTLQTLSVLV